MSDLAGCTPAESAISAAELASGEDLLARAFVEDLGPDGIDLTAPALGDVALEGVVVARQDGVVCGLQLAVRAFELRGTTRARQLVADGAWVEAGTSLVDVAGTAASVLAAERTALNVVQRLAGIATRTRAYVDAVQGTGARILDTRKTMPGMRALQRWAVRCGGGANHRFGLFDEAMLKDNHVAVCGSVAAAVERIRSRHPGVRVHVEADTVEQAAAAADAGADVVLLDNMRDDVLRAAVAAVGGRALTEASGGVTLRTVATIARTGVDRISVGELTHSAPAFDASLDARS